MDNPNPVTLSIEEIKKKNELRSKRAPTQSQVQQTPSISAFSDTVNFEHVDIPRDAFDSEEVFDLIRNLTDPEHPLTLEQLSVVSPTLIDVDNDKNSIRVFFTPTIPHCSQATLIGLMIRAKLHRCLPPRFKVDIFITLGTHNTEEAINKQLNDKERVAAALENPSILRVINRGVTEEDIDDVARWAII